MNYRELTDRVRNFMGDRKGTKNYNLNSALNYNEEGTGTFILNALKIAL